MKATGIVKKFDSVGRIVIPKELRRTLRIHDCAPLEIYTDTDGSVVIQKYSPVGELVSISMQYAEAINTCTGLAVLITDRDAATACAGIAENAVLYQCVSRALAEIMEKQTNFIAGTYREAWQPVEQVNAKAAVVYPIICSGEAIGSVSLLIGDNGEMPAPGETKLAQMAALFLGIQAEDDG
ncbi:MAG: stage V sporulation protein T [Oscillospiraceae bacterium]|jgi:AbrB family transcriptional regulator (stage V sporulation protein T)|nr:stage V sporulation protein T [Oscillospiraceae bacterium]